MFCLLISSAEYFPEQQAEDVKIELEADQNDAAPSDESKLWSLSVNAVVPFLTVLAQQVYLLIFEIFSFENPVPESFITSIPLNHPFWEILFERIISPNAP